MSQAPLGTTQTVRPPAVSRAPETEASVPAPPRIVVWASVAVCIAGLAMLLLGAWQVGISTDEPVHVARFQNLEQHGWYLLDDDFVGDEPASWVTDRYVYGPVFTQVGHAVNRALGLDPAGALGTSLDAYVARHLLVAACGLLATLAVAATGRRLLGSWLWGLVSAAVLVAVPMWTGLSMFDFKDVPAATGYTLVTLALVGVLTDRRPGWWAAGWPVVVLALGLVLGVGTRPGLWPGLVASIGLAALLSLVPSARREAGVARPLLQMALAGVVAYAVLWWAYPAYFSRPDEWVLGSVLDSSDYTAGPTGTATGSRAYLPASVLLLMPPVLLLGGVVGCLTVVGRRVRLTPATGGWLLVASQALLLPVLAVARQSLLYDGLRQVLFALPAVALLLTWGWRTLVGDVGRTSRAAQRVVAAVWAVALLVPLAVQAQLFPFGYTYAAPYATRLGAVPDNDFWRVSYRELVPEVPRGDFVACYPVLSPWGTTMRTLPATGRPAAESSADCRTDPMGTLAPFGLAAGDGRRFQVADTFVALFSRGQVEGSNCHDLASVERRRYVEDVVMSTVARCELVLYPYPDGGVVLRPDGTGADYLLGGWTAHPALPGVRLREPAGSLGFELPQDWADRPLELRLTGTSPHAPRVLVNNQPVAATADTDGWVLDVPAGTVTALGDRRLAVTVSPSVAGDPVVLTGVRVDPA